MYKLDRKIVFLTSIFFILVGIFFRFYQLNFENYWFDEMNSFWVADPNISLNDMIARRQLTDQTPLLFNLILKNYFKIFTYNPEVGRQVPFIFGILAIPLLGILSYQIKKDNSFLLTILLISINIYLIKYSQETRPYSLVFLLSIINLIFYYKIILINFTSPKKIHIFLLFIFFSVISLSSHPFVFIIFFSQITYCIYSFFVFKNKNILFFLSIPIILVLYFFINYDYLISQLAHKEYFLNSENWSFFYNYYFSRFFGSKIMGFIYLSTLIFLIIRFKKKILFTRNNYLPLIFILIFSYIIPLIYGLIRTPILTDRYIIFVLIPILILISSLIFEINNKKLKIFFLIFVLFPTVINQYIEIKYRINTKPEFIKLLNSLKDHKIKNLTLQGSDLALKLVKNYVISTKVFKKNDFKIFDIKNLPSDIRTVWIICYEPLMGFNCDITDMDEQSWILLNTKKKYLVSARLFKIRN
jgi:hypothetical protein